MENRPTMFCVLNSLDVHRGGMTKAALMQANLFVEQGYETFIVTFNFNSRYHSIIKEMVDLGKVDRRIHILNMYESLSRVDHSILQEQPNETIARVKGENAVWDRRKGFNAFRIYENGLYTTYINYDESNQLGFIDYFNEQRYRTKREDYDEFGYLRKVTYMDYVSNKARQMLFLDDNGRVYLSKLVNHNDGKTTRVNYYDKNNGLKAVYLNDLELKTKWLESIIQDYDYPILVCDARASDPVMVNLKVDKAIKIWRLHSNHVKSPYNVDGEVTDVLAPTFAALDDLDVALVLTETQKKDLEKRFGKKEQFRVIPNCTDEFVNFGWFNSVKIDDNLAVVVSRFSTLKRIDHTIKAFRIVVDKLPEAKLDLWGFGDEEKNLISLIKDLKLENHVKLKGFTLDPKKIYQEALFSVLASKSEGFPLGILESMSNGTPLISYDINYGPRDIITDNVDGFIVEKGNIDQLAEKMIWMFENKKSALKMGKTAAKNIKERFGKEQYTEKWIDTIEYAIEHKKEKLRVTQLQK